MNRGRLVAAALTSVVVAAAVTIGVVRVGASEPSYSLAGGGMGSGGGDLGNADYGLAANAGQTALGEARGGGISVSSGEALRPDACPAASGTTERQGCDLAIGVDADLHVVDQAKSGACRQLTGVDAGSCAVPLDGAKVKAFDRARLEGLTIARRDGSGEVTLTRNPDGALYDDLFEASGPSVVAALAAPFGCVTVTPGGECLAGVPAAGDQLVIARWRGPEANAPLVYTGLPHGASAFVDTDGDGAADLASRQLQIVKTIRKDGIFYTGGSKTVVTGSYLEMVRPDRIEWPAGAATYTYPFALTADSAWRVELCASLPAGFAVTGVRDEKSSLLSPVTSLLGTCVTRSVAKGDRLVAAFEVTRLAGPLLEIGSAAPLLSVTARTLHNNERKQATMSVPGTVSALTALVGG